MASNLKARIAQLESTSTNQPYIFMVEVFVDGRPVGMRIDGVLHELQDAGTMNELEARLRAAIDRLRRPGVAKVSRPAIIRCSELDFLVL